MSDLNVALVMRLIDQITAPLAKVRDSLEGVSAATGNTDAALSAVTSGADGAAATLKEAFGPDLARDIGALKPALEGAADAITGVKDEAAHGAEALKEAFGPHLPARIDDVTTSVNTSAGAMQRWRRGVGDFGSAFSAELRRGFSAENIEAALRQNEAKVREARGRLIGAFGMGLTLAAPVMVAGNFEAELIQFGNLADLDREKLRALGQELDALSRRDITGQSSSTLLKGLETYVGKGMDVDAALEALPATARAAKATGAAFDEMAAAGFAAIDNLGVAPADLAKALDIMAASGKEGSFELRDMARNFPELTASAKALGMEGTKGVASLAAALQIAMKSAGSADQAANNTANFLGKLTTPDAVKKFKEAGVDIQKELEGALARGADPLEHMLTTIERMTGGDQFKMGELFADKQVLDFLRAAIPNLEEYRRIMEKTASAEGIIDADYARNMEGFNESLRQLRQSFQGLLGGASPLLPILTDMLNGVTTVVDRVRDWTAANPELTAFLVKGAAAALAFGIGARVLGYAFAVGRGNLIRFASLFLKFTAEGRNISVIARALRGLGRGLSWASIIPKLSWRTIVPVLSWAPFLPKLAWTSVAGVLRWSLLIPALRWTARFIPVIGWAALAGQLAWSLIIKPLGWDEWIKDIDWAALLAPFRWSNIITTSLNIGEFISRFSWRDVLPNWDWGAIIPDLGSWIRTNTPGGAPYDSGLFRQPEMLRPILPGTSEADADIGAYLKSIEIAPPAGRKSAMNAPARPLSRPETIKVEETVNHDYKADHTVTVTVPVTIQQHIRTNAAELSREIGARTERATRRALSDAMIPE